MLRRAANSSPSIDRISTRHALLAANLAETGTFGPVDEYKQAPLPGTDPGVISAKSVA
jgi:hypothetical protein